MFRFPIIAQKKNTLLVLLFHNFYIALASNTYYNTDLSTMSFPHVNHDLFGAMRTWKESPPNQSQPRPFWRAFRWVRSQDGSFRDVTTITITITITQTEISKQISRFIFHAIKSLLKID